VVTLFARFRQNVGGRHCGQKAGGKE
jgi:hypothetical protein